MKFISTCRPTRRIWKLWTRLAIGRVQAKQHQRGDGDFRKVLAVLTHGDAAADQGVVAETFAFSALRGYHWRHDSLLL